MRVALVGNQTNLDSRGKSFNSEAHFALSLEDIGCEVTFIQENEIVPGTLPELVRGHDLFFWVRTWGLVTDNDLMEIRAMGIPSISVHLDIYVGLKRESGLDNDSFWRTDFVFSADGDPNSAKVFAEKGINHYYLPPGVYGPECVKGTSRDEFKTDVLFVGGSTGYHEEDWPYRAELVDWLHDTYGSRFKKFGYPEPTIRGLDLNDLYASAKVVVGDSLCMGFKHKNYTSDRLFETVGRGGFLIYPNIEGITNVLMGDQKDCVFYEYGNFAQLKTLVDFFSHDSAAAQREHIRDTGMARVKREHTYTHRMQAMLDVLKAEGAIK